MTSSIVEQDYWDAAYAKLDVSYDSERVLFRELFERYLKPGGTCFEVGCYPGNFLIYLGTRFGYTVGGIDTTPFISSRLPQRLARHGVAVGDLYREDFLKFTIPRRYDVVCSFGFIEHFRDFEEVIRKHIALVAPRGTLIISCPNFRRGQYALHRLFDAPNLRHHVLEAMDLAKWGKVMKTNGMNVVHQGYYQTFDFWVDAPPRNQLMAAAANLVVRAAGGVNRRFDLPNRWLSPYMISIARKN